MRQHRTFIAFFIISASALLVARPVQVARADVQSQAELFVAQVKPRASVIHTGKSHEAKPPEILYEGDWIQTGPKETAYLEFQNGGVVEVGPDSRVQVKTLEITPKDFKARFLLALGRFKAKVMKLTTASSTFEVQAGGVVAGVRGTVFGVDYDPGRDQVSAATYEGTIFTRSDGRMETVDKGYGAVMDHAGAPSVSQLTHGQIQSFEQFDDVAGLLQRKKQEMLDDMKNQASRKIPQVVPDQDALQNAIGQKLGL